MVNMINAIYVQSSFGMAVNWLSVIYDLGNSFNSFKMCTNS